MTAIRCEVDAVQVVTQRTAKAVGRPKRPDSCDVCKLIIPDGAPMLFGVQEPGCGVYPGMSGWYIAVAHADPCGTRFIANAEPPYVERACRGCHRTMWIRPGNRRSHCTNQCRQSDYRRRRELSNAELANGRVMYRDELYWATS